MYYKYTILFAIALVTILLQIRVYYDYYLQKYFRNGDEIVYDYLIKFINCISKDNFFMNYGLWDQNNTNLKNANKNLCNFIFENAHLNSNDTFHILDVGCGYGKQDFLLHNMLSSSSKIVAIDLSKKQVDFANRCRKRNHIHKKQLKFVEGDAHCLVDQFFCKKFNRIISIESAFHYKDRPLFFNSVSSLLTNDGLFVISDIMLKDTYKPTIMNKLFLNIASDFLCIPEKNLITLSQWKKQVKKCHLKIVKLHDITDKTFTPYYKFFFENYIRNQNLPDFIADMLIYIFNIVQPFSYVVAVCKKRVGYFKHF
jgi:cyclopropane fatty-acyl-phospholipid synthase-like methyltransferase